MLSIKSVFCFLIGNGFFLNKKIASATCSHQNTHLFKKNAFPNSDSSPKKIGFSVLKSINSAIGVEKNAFVKNHELVEIETETSRKNSA